MDKNMDYGFNYPPNTAQNAPQYAVPNASPYSPFYTMGMEQEQDPFFNPMMQYEQGYLYYRYLTQQMDYKIKCKEYEKFCETNSRNSTKRPE